MPDVEPGGPMTPEALEAIADWLDIFDKMATRYWNVLRAVGFASEENLLSVERITEGTEAQDDLRRWAAELRAQAVRLNGLKHDKFCAGPPDHGGICTRRPDPE